MKKLVFTLAFGLFFVTFTNAQSLKSDQADSQAKVIVEKKTDAKEEKASYKDEKADAKTDLKSDKKSCATKSRSCGSKKRPNSCKD